MTRTSKLILGFLGLVLIWAIMLLVKWDDIEKQIASAVQRELEQAGFSQVTVDTEYLGRSVVLSGLVRSSEAIEAVQEVASGVDGVRSVDTSSIDIRPFKPSVLSILSRQGNVVITGALQRSATANRVIDAVRESLHANIDGTLSVHPDIEQPEWGGPLAGIMATLSKVEDLSLSISQDMLRISGISRSAGDHESALAAISALPGITSVDADSLTMRPYEPPWFALQPTASGLLLRGGLKSRADQARLEQALASSSLPLFASEITIDRNFDTVAWIGDVQKVMTSLARVENPLVGYRGGSLAVTGIVRDSAAFDAVAETAKQLTATRELDLSALEVRPYRAPWLHVELTPQKVFLNGEVHEDAVADRLRQQVFEGVQGSNRREFQGRISFSRDTHPDIWAQAFDDVLNRAGDIESGYLDLQGDTLKLSGIVREEEDFQAIQKTVSTITSAHIVDSSGLELRPLRAPRFAISTVGSRTIASGRVGRKQDFELLREGVQLIFGAEASTQILQHTDVVAAKWVNSVMRLLPSLTGLESGTVVANEQGIQVSGVARSEQAHQLVANAVSELDSALVNNHVQFRPWLEPAFSVRFDNGTLSASGRLPDEDSQSLFASRLAALGKATGLGIKSTVETNKDVKRTRWLRPMIEALDSLSVVLNPTLQVGEGRTTVAGTVANEIHRERVINALSIGSGDMLLNSALSLPPPVRINSGAGALLPVDETMAMFLPEPEVILYPEVSREQLDRCEQGLDAPLDGKTIEFAFGSANLEEASTEVLEEIMQAIEDCPKVIIEVAGHTDNIGTDETNFALSDRRARAVVDYLVEAGLARARLSARGYGSSRPVGDNETEQGRALNRRIEFNVKTTR